MAKQGKRKKTSKRKKQVQDFDVLRSLNRLLDDRYTDKRARKARVELAEYVCAPNTTQGVVDRIISVSMALDQVYWMVCKEKRVITKRVTDEILHAIADCLFEKEILNVALESYGLFFMDQKVITAEAIDFMKGNYSTKEEGAAAALHMFITEFMFYVGTQLEKSIQFALYLQEEFREMIVEGIGSGGVDLGVRSNGQIAFHLIFTTSVHPPLPNVAVRGWLDQLIGNLSDPTVEQVFDGIYKILVLMNPDDRLSIYKFGDKRMVEYLKVMKRASWFKATEENIRCPSLVVSLEQAKVLLERDDKLTEKKSVINAQGNRVLEWFKTQRQQVAEILEKRCAEISEPRRGLRPGGMDHVDIKVQALVNAGVRSIVFYPEGCVFPDMSFKVYVRAETPHLIEYSGAIEGFEMKFDEKYLTNSVHDRSELRKVLWFVIVDIIHRLTVGDEHSLTKKSRSRKTSESNGEKPISVRPHYMRLQPGHKASDAAKDRAVKSGLGLPPVGRTFVRATYRAESGQGLQYVGITEPSAVYCDDDIFVECVGVAEEEVV